MKDNTIDFYWWIFHKNNKIKKDKLLKSEKEKKIEERYDWYYNGSNKKKQKLKDKASSDYTVDDIPF
jgi:hypothetical protein